MRFLRGFLLRRLHRGSRRRSGYRRGGARVRVTGCCLPLPFGALSVLVAGWLALKRA